MSQFEMILAAAALDDRDETTLRHAAQFALAAQSQAI
jgi:hypothetical protein